MEICGLCHTKVLRREPKFIRFAFQPKLAKVYLDNSSAIALREHFSPEQIKQGTMHQTNKAFERYFRIGADDIRLIYKEAANSNKNKSTETKKLRKNN